MSSKNRVFFGKLPYDTRVRDIEKWLDDYGYKHIGSVHLKTGYAFVDFDDARDSEDCVRELDRKEFMGVRITVEFARGSRSKDSYDRHDSRDSRDRHDRHDRYEKHDRYDKHDRYEKHSSRKPYTSNGYFRERYGAPYNTEWRLAVKNLSSRVGWQDMKDFFRQAGKVTFTECHKHKSGEGFVEFATQDELKRAIDKLDGEDLMGRKIKLIDESPGIGSKRDGHSRTRVSRSVSRERGRRRRDSRSVSRSPYQRGGSSEKENPRQRERSISQGVGFMA